MQRKQHMSAYCVVLSKLVHFPSCRSNSHINMTYISQTLIYQHETVTSQHTKKHQSCNLTVRLDTRLYALKWEVNTSQHIKT